MQDTYDLRRALEQSKSTFREIKTFLSEACDLVETSEFTMPPFLLKIFQIHLLGQCKSVVLAAQDIDKGIKEGNNEFVFYALQNLLVAGANISKILWGQTGKEKLARQRKPLRDSIGIADDSPLREVRMRNNYEHMDERLDDWYKKSKNRYILDLTVGRKDLAIAGVDEIDRFRLLDKYTGDATFWGDEFNVRALVKEVEKILPKLKAEVSKTIAAHTP